MKDLIAYRIEVYGKVQGVGFRYFTRVEALKYGLKGTVENRDDGSVFIVVEGEENKVVEFLDWCHHGPESSFVESLRYSKCELSDHEDFRIKR